MGNLFNLERLGNGQTIDYLNYTYNGNQVTSISDDYGSQNQTSVKEYQDLAGNSQNEMSYDANGNLTKDLDRDIVTIKYNVLNLPDIIQFSNGNQIKNLYDAGGQKLESRYYTRITQIPVPIEEKQIATDVNSVSDYLLTGTDYAGNFEYAFSNDGGDYQFDLDKIYNDEGYVQNPANPRYYYYRKDHLGDNREVWCANTNEVVQRTQYYPSGLPWVYQTGDNPDLQHRKYNGKEFIEMHGYDCTDLGNRVDYHAINRMPTMDRFAEKYPWQSPYCMAANNPVNYIDVNGDSIWVSVYNSNTNNNDRYYYGTDSNGNSGFIGKDGKIYSGDNQFVSDLTDALSELDSESFGESLVDDLANSTKNVTIARSRNEENKAGEDGTYILWNPKNTEGGMSENGSTSRPSFVGLGHEMGHIQDKWKGTFDNSTWITVDGKKIQRSEIYATHIENQIRAEHGIPLRTHYAVFFRN